MWVRGLKPNAVAPYPAELGVAPHVGAWIETDVSLMLRISALVAPHVGAWIET